MARIRIHPPITVDELTIREYRMDDLEQLDAAIIRNREYLLPWIGPWIKAEPIGIDTRRTLLQSWVDSYPEGADNPVGIFIGEDLIGGTGLHDRNGEHDIEIGYWVDEAHQGRGIATRVTATLRDLAFTSPDVHRFLLFHNVGNDRSRRIPERLGMAEVPGAHTCGDDAAVLWETTREMWAAGA
jgi:ribosomal-protein-serine acetyltransferase